MTANTTDTQIDEHRGSALILRAKLIGPFALMAPDGTDLTPKGIKARAIIALSVMAPDLLRSRTYLAATLWSDRGRAQAFGSLRQSIAEIRKALGSYADRLVIDRANFGFQPDTIETDLHEAKVQGSEKAVLLEDLETTDPVFSEWLSSARAQLGMQARLSTRPLVRVEAEGSASPMQKDILMHGIAEAISDWCAARVVTVGDDPDRFAAGALEDYSDYLIQARLDQAGQGVTAHLNMSAQRPDVSRWSMTAQLSGADFNPLDDTALFQMINRAADRTIHDLAPAHRDKNTAQFLTAGTLGAVRSIFRNDPGDLESARSQLTTNFDLQREGIYLAWLAYITTLEMAERNENDPQSLREKARELSARAIELDPYGSMTLALCSYVQSFVLGDRMTGHEFAMRSIESNRANPMAWIFAGAAHFLEGRGDAALENTMFGRKISGEGPYSYVVDTFCCAAATCAHRFDEALMFAERAAAKAPNYKAPLRYMIAIHATRGDIDNVRLAIRRLRRIEPNFTIDSMKSQKYPVPGLRAAGLVSFG